MTDAMIAKCEKVQKLSTGDRRGRITATAAMKKVGISNYSYYSWLQPNGRVKAKKRSVTRIKKESRAELIALLNAEVADLKEETATLWDIIKAIT